jgi:endonuclease/exonuclease/phosphatase family metal-dependent hydrolase
VTELRIVSYNIHGCVGLDKRHAPSRIAAVIRDTQAPIVGLQEVDTHSIEESSLDQLEYLAKKTRMEAVAGPTLARRVGHYGNALLTRFPIRAVRRLDLSVPGREPRGAIDVDLEIPGGALLRVFVTHFGLKGFERREQLRVLLPLVREEPERPCVVLGDFNEWSRKGEVIRELDAVLEPSQAVPSFPSWWPILSLDRIWVRPRAAFRSARAFVSLGSRIASDHLPVVATLDV